MPKIPSVATSNIPKDFILHIFTGHILYSPSHHRHHHHHRHRSRRPPVELFVSSGISYNRTILRISVTEDCWGHTKYIPADLELQYAWPERPVTDGQAYNVVLSPIYHHDIPSIYTIQPFGRDYRLQHRNPCEAVYILVYCSHIYNKRC